MSVKQHFEGRDYSRGKLPCPDCRMPIPLDFRRMFTGEAVECVNCGLALSLNLAQNRDTIEAIKDAQQTMAKATGGQIKPF